MKVLYATTSQAPNARTVPADLLRLESELEIRTVEGAAGALVEIPVGGYGALFVSPSVPHNDTLALISSVRRDRTPIAVVAIVTDADRLFFRHAITAGADYVLLLRGERLIAVEDAPNRVRQKGQVALASEPAADEIVGKMGTTRRRLVASLHRVFLRHLPSEVAPDAAATPPRVAAPPGPQGAAEAEIYRLTAALQDAEERIAALSDAEQSATVALTALRVDHDHLREAQAFERALRDRDREELARVTRELREERDRRIVMEGTLAQTEDYAKAEQAALQEDVAAAADRLHRVAHNTQSLQTRLEQQLAGRVAERDRLTDNALIGHAVLTRAGQLVRCSEAFASMLGYADANEAVAAGTRGAFPGTPDHAQILAKLDQGGTLERVESTLRRADGRPVQVLTSATLLPAAPDAESQVERLIVDLTDQTAAEVELRLARRLEAAGRLAAEMASQIEAAVANLEREGNPSPAQQELTLLVGQLVAFSRHQAKPAGFLSLNDAVARAEPALRQIAGGAVDFRFNLGSVQPVTAGEDDLEHLLIDVVTTAAACLPFGGRLTLATNSDTDSTFVLRTTLSVTAAGYGVLPCVTSPSLVRHTARCGGSLRISGEAGHSSTLHVHLPC
jgi:PAS domain-containing protein